MQNKVEINFFRFKSHEDIRSAKIFVITIFTIFLMDFFIFRKLKNFIRLKENFYPDSFYNEKSVLCMNFLIVYCAELRIILNMHLKNCNFAPKTFFFRLTHIVFEDVNL